MRYVGLVALLFIISCGGGGGNDNYEGESFGCGEPGWGRQQISNVTRAPDTKPWCGAYTLKLSDDELQEFSTWGTTIIEYDHDVTELCHQLETSGNGVKAYIYMDLDKGRNSSELDLFLDELIRDVRACHNYRDRFKGFYLDEPDFNNVATSKIEKVVSTLRGEFPELGFFMYYFFDSSCVPPGTTHRGLLFYDKKAGNKSITRDRIERVHNGSNLPVIVIPRAFSDDHSDVYDDFTDSEVAQNARQIYEVANELPYVVGSMHYILTGEEGFNAKLPQTTEAIHDYCG
ncbi:MAG: hypothetical protein O2794_02955 [bacterium]|nr:hypothetical protein [bacterium]